jgi:hypothetical protein
MDFYRGTRIGKYEVLTQLSLGGMAELFLAFTAGPGGFRKYVVVKRILPDVKGDEQFVKMFLDEARITAALNHPNIAQVFDLGEEEDGLYLAMEFISGQNLNQVAAACNRARRVIPVGFSCAVARDVLNALHHAHSFTDHTGRSYPVIHRDVAQKNIMVTYDGVTKLLDFGIAKARGKLGRTALGLVKGTTGYMSPEQVRGEEVDGRSDVFSVGVVLHEMLSGERLFSAQTEAEEMKLILEGPIPRLHEVNELVPVALCDVVMRALSRERADRFPTAREMARALERVVGPLLFDPEQAALLMKELFAEKMAATRALLESAEDPAVDATGLVRVAMGNVKVDPGMDFEESVVRKRRKPRPAEPPPPAVPATAATAPAAAVRDTRASASPERDSRWGTGVAGLVAVIIVGGGFGVWKLVFALPPATEDRVSEADTALKPLPVWQDPRLKPFPEPVVASPASAPPAAADDAGSATAAAPPGTEEEARPARRRKAAEGTLTLVTVPECVVMRGKKELGKTPLFNVALPAGTHLLRLKAPDGKVRVLSAPIKAGEKTAFRVVLAELPTE